MRISEEDHARIAAAVAQAELGTSGEIRCVLAAETGAPALGAVTAGALLALLSPAILALFGLPPERIGEALSGWRGPAAAQWLILAAYAGVQALVMVAALLLGAIPAVRRLLTPAPIRRARVRAAAEAQFEALGLTHTRDHTGVLLYASLAEHRAEVLADSGIWEKTRPEEWQGVADLLVAGLAKGRPVDGFVEAVAAAGSLLKDRLPPRADDSNELPDGLTVKK